MTFEIRITGATVRRALLGMLLVAAVGGLAWGGWLLLRSDPFGGYVDPDRYQAVYLVNGQVYFGHLEDAGDELYLVQEAFFIAEVPGEGEGAPPIQQVRSVREEFHQPDGDILIPKQAVIRVDNLTPDSEVALAIDRVLEEG
jgi:hypothetical protein